MRYPEGYVGETVGLSDGWSSSKPRLVKIIGTTKTTVSVDDNGKRRTFMRSHWEERGSAKSRYAPYIMSEARARFYAASEREGALKRRMLDNLHTGTDALTTARQYRAVIGTETLEQIVADLEAALAQAKEDLVKVKAADVETEVLRHEAF